MGLNVGYRVGTAVGAETARTHALAPRAGLLRRVLGAWRREACWVRRADHRRRLELGTRFAGGRGRRSARLRRALVGWRDAARRRRRVQRTLPMFGELSAPMEDACLLLAIKLVESMDAPLGRPSEVVIRSEAAVAQKLGWRLSRETLFDAVTERMGVEPCIEMARMTALVAMAEEGGDVCDGRDALVRAILGEVPHPAVERLSRVALVVDRDDLVSISPGARRIVVTARRFLDNRAFVRETSVYADLPEGGGRVHAIASASPLGTALTLVDDAVPADRVQRPSHLIWWTREGGNG